MTRESTPRATPRTVARHGRLPRQRTVVGLLQLVGAALVVVLVSGLLVAGITVQQLSSNITSVALDGEGDGPPPSIGNFEGGFNVLIVGIDEFHDRDSVLNDVNILVHVAEDQSNATAISFPRDLVVPIPSCPREDGEGRYPAMSARPLNEAYGYGGLACVVLAIENLTDLDIPFAGTTTFLGVVNMSTAVGGVTVCTNGPIIDPAANGLVIPSAGEWSLEGWQALGFLRTRYGVGDGSDLGRISNQQVFLSALMRKLTAEGTLDDPATLYRLATTVTDSMTLSNSMTNVTTLVSMASVLRNMSLDRITFVQYPSTTEVGGIYQGKVAPVRAVAEELMERIRNDEPVVADTTGRGSVPDSAPPSESPAPVDPAPVDPAPVDPAPVDPGTSPEPGDVVDPAVPTEPEAIDGLLGQSAADNTCSRVNR